MYLSSIHYLETFSGIFLTTLHNSCYQLVLQRHYKTTEKVTKEDFSSFNDDDFQNKLKDINWNVHCSS